MGMVLTGNPVLGYISLTNAAPGPVAFAIFTILGVAAGSLAATQRIYITNITVSSNDTANTGIVTVDSAGTTPTPIAKVYIPTNQQPLTVSIPPGCAKGIFGVVPRAGIASVTAGKTVEVTFQGYISST